jgi:zinc protease
MKSAATKRMITAMLVSAMAATAALAQEASKGTSVKSVQRLGRAPVSHEVLQVRLPRPQVSRLPNGLTLVIVPQHKLPTVNLALWIKSGALEDPKDMPGLAKFTAEMLREGTARRTSAQIAAAVDELGAVLRPNAAFGSSHSEILASGLTRNLDKLLDLVSDIVIHPSFPADELEKYKARQAAELEQERSTPDFLARERLYRALYGEFPAAVVAPTPASVKAVTPQQLNKFHDDYYAPSNAVLGVAGDVDPRQITALLARYFGIWKDHPVHAARRTQVAAPARPKVYLIDRPDSVQTNIVAGDLALRRTDPDFIPLQVTNRVLGGGPTGRLFLELREEKGYTYGAYSYFTTDLYPGAFLAETEVRNAVTDPALHSLLSEIERMRTQAVPETELDEARRSMVASFALSLEQPERLLNYWMTAKYYGLPDDYWDRYPAEVAKVDPGTVQRVARKYLDRVQVVCVGNAKQIKDSLAKYGPIEIYDVEGRPAGK